MLGWAESAHWKLSNEIKEKLMGDLHGCAGCKKWFLVIACLTFALIILSGAFLNTFSYEKEGFLSYHGGSQYLHVTMYIAWQIQSIALIGAACRLDKTTKIMNENVKGLSEQDAINAGL